MTNGEKTLNVFPNATTRIVENEGFTYIEVEQNDKWIADFDMEWWNAEYKEPTIEHEQKIDKSAMMHEIYMQGVNMGGEYQGCWVRFKEIEKIVDRYVR